jgi:hypothetical protein
MYELPSSDDKTLVIDAEYAQETLNKNQIGSIITCIFSKITTCSLI